MAKCTKCGADLVDGAVFCGNCGTAVENNNAEQQVENNNAEQQAENNNAEQQAENNQAQDFSKVAAEKGKEIAEKGKDLADKGKDLAGKGLDAVENNKYVQELNGKLEQKTGIKNTGLIAAIAGCAVVAIVAVLAIVLVFGGGYKKRGLAPIKFLNSRGTSYEKYLKKSMGKTFAKFTLERELAYAKLGEDGKDKKEYLSDIKDQYEELYDGLNDKYGKNWKIKYKVDSVKKVKSSDLRDAKDLWEKRMENLEDEVDKYEDYEDIADKNDWDEKDTKAYYNCIKKWYKKLNKLKIKAGYKIKLKNVQIKGKDDDDELGDKGKVEIYVYKLGNEWVCMGSTIEYELQSRLLKDSDDSDDSDSSIDVDDALDALDEYSDAIDGLDF